MYSCPMSPLVLFQEHSKALETLVVVVIIGALTSRDIFPSQCLTFQKFLIYCNAQAEMILLDEEGRQLWKC